MKNKFFKIPVSNTVSAESELNSFCSAHSINHIERHFVADGENSFWAIAVTYSEQSNETTSTNKRSERIDYKELLSANDFTIYARLRDERAKIAKEKGIAVYAIFSNEQLSQMIIQKIRTKAALQKIGGVGKSRADHYGDIFIKLIRGSD